MLSSGMPVALIQTVPWMIGRHAPAVRASLAAHDPSRPVVATVQHAEPMVPLDAERLRANAITSDKPAEWEPESAPSDEPQLFFRSVDEFVRERLRCTYIRRVGATSAYPAVGRVVEVPRGDQTPRLPVACLEGPTPRRPVRDERVVRRRPPLRQPIA